jgi:hypothetical protein
METVRRIYPLGGIVYAVAVLAAYGVVSGDSPNIDASPSEIASFYGDETGAEQAAALLIAFGAPFLALFTVALWKALAPAAPERSGAATMALVGGAVAVSGILAQAGVHLALAEGADEGVEPVALQALSTLDEDIFLVAAAGLGILLLGSAGAILGRGALPRWLGWSALAIGALSFTFAAFQAFVLAHAWVVIASVVLVARGSRSPAPAPPVS